MNELQKGINRLKHPFEVGRLIASGRKRLGISQTAFSSRLGVSRKTLSDLERGAAEHVSLKTALRALALAGFVVDVSPHRPPTLAEVMANRARELTLTDAIPERESSKRRV